MSQSQSSSGCILRSTNSSTGWGAADDYRFRMAAGETNRLSAGVLRVLGIHVFGVGWTRFDVSADCVVEFEVAVE